MGVREGTVGQARGGNDDKARFTRLNCSVGVRGRPNAIRRNREQFLKAGFRLRRLAGP